MMRSLAIAALASGIVIASGCSRTIDEPKIVEARDLAHGYSLARTASGELCVTAGDPLTGLCRSTRTARGVGFHDRFIAVRIDVPAKEYLLIDTSNGYVWVLSRAEFRACPESANLTMTSLDGAWEQLGWRSGL